METAPGWIAIAIGAFIVWLAWGRKKNRVRDNPGQPVIFVPVPGARARKRTNPLVVVLLFVALIVFYSGGATG